MRFNPLVNLRLKITNTIIAIVLIVMTVGAVQPLLQPSFPRTHDGENHLGRIANYYLAFREGQFPPRLAPSMMGGYGYPVFNYNYPLVNMLGVPFLAIGFDVELTMKILLSLLTFIGVIGWFGLGKSSGKLAGIILAGLFLSSNFLYNTIFVRGVVGELASIALLPHFILSLRYFESYFKNSSRKKSRAVMVASMMYFWIVTTSFLLAHNLSVVMFFIPMVAYGLTVCWRMRTNLIGMRLLILTTISAVLTSLFFWIPAIFEQDLVGIKHVDLINFYADHFPSVSQLLTGPPTQGYSVIGPVDGMGFGVGLATIVALLIIGGRLLFKPTLLKKSELVLPLFGVFFGVLIMLSAMKPVWDNTGLLQLFQFPWRWLLFVQASALFLTIPLLISKNVKVLFSIIILIQFIWIGSLEKPTYIRNTSDYYFSFAETSTVQHENKPNTLITEPGTIAERFPEVEPNVEVSIHRWTGSSREYTVVSETPHEVTEQTAFFPGWEVRVNGELVAIEHQRTEGFITFDVPAGTSTITTRFTQNTPPRLIGNAVSIFGLLSFGLLLLWVSNINRHTVLLLLKRWNGTLKA